MSFENLKLPKNVRKKKLIGKIKHKNRSNAKEDENFKDKIKLYDKHLEFIFSESEVEEKRNMIAYTSLFNKDELDTFVDEEGKERMEIDWSSGEFSDSDEEIQLDKKSDISIKKKKWKNKFLKSKKIDKINNLEIENVTPNLIDDKIKNKLPIKKWKKQATKLFKKSKKLIKDNTERTDESKEPNYEGTEDKRLHGRKEESIYENIENQQLYAKKEEPIYEKIEYGKHQLYPNEEYSVTKKLKKSPQKVPPLPPLNTMPRKRPTSQSPEKGSSGSTGFTPKFIKPKDLMYDDYKSARFVMNKNNLFDTFDPKTENIQIKRKKITNLKDENKATFITFKSPKKDNIILKDQKIAKIGKIVRMDRK